MDLFKNFADRHILVIGDVMLDSYWHGDTERVSPEAPVPVVNITEKNQRLGGAANVALNTRLLGVKTTLVGLCGNDKSGAELKQLLEKHQINDQLLALDDYETINKLRVVGRGQQLLRLDFETPNASHQAVLLERISTLLKDVDLVVLSDYNKGTLAGSKAIIAACKKQNIPVLVDPKQKDFSCYQGATLITPNFMEFKNCVGPCEQVDEIELKGRALMAQHGLENLLITLGARGMVLLSADKKSYQIQSKAKEVFDITGAGDTVIASLACFMVSGLTINQATQYANMAAGIVVGRFGTASVSQSDLLGEMTKSSVVDNFVSESRLKMLIDSAKKAGKKIVMTNGCFDILHPGHITYLREARELGDILILALNSDASVSRLKGPSRPVHNLEHRACILGALDMIDWVVPFTEDTPARLIELILPDILVKGGDYKPEEVAGGTAVVKNGGYVKILQFVDGFSSSQSIEKMRQPELATS